MQLFNFLRKNTTLNGLVFIDVEVDADDKIHDIAALRDDDSTFHNTSARQLQRFIDNAEYVCGHNIIHHDLKYVAAAIGKSLAATPIDTLYWSPLLFPKRPYHRLVKNDKLQVDELNNPLNDCQKAKDLFYDEVNAFNALAEGMRRILYTLLHDKEEFAGLFQYIGYSQADDDVAGLIKHEFDGRLCTNADIRSIAAHQPTELAYALALITADDDASITPAWVMHTFPGAGNVMNMLRNVPCRDGCRWCGEKMNIHRQLKDIFGFDRFRLFNEEPLQENAVRAAVEGRSLLAVFPTGGGKSMAFQLPALMSGRNSHALTVVISPLQSLMKDQVDNLDARGVHEAVTVNGLLDPIERANALERASDGTASIIYISPESLRSRTIERILLERHVARFVIDEAHCFSAWGQDFRVDYLYIAEFIRQLQELKGDGRAIPVSCFTATAKQKVISDIRDYFRKHLNIEMQLYATNEARRNLRYAVLHVENEAHKYSTLRDLITLRRCPTIVYVSRTRQAEKLAERLTGDGVKTLAFHGKMGSEVKTDNQDAFIRNEVECIVATSAFGMGVDKKDVGLVVHYDISGSLEDYVQESGRAGRDPETMADCFVLYNDADLDKHFLLLSQSKLSMNDIQQVWSGIKGATRQRRWLSCSPLELARLAGWDDTVEMETRVKSAVAALENAGYVRRGKNMPRIYATGILVKNMEEAARRIDASTLLGDEQREKAKRIIKSLISSRSRARAKTDEAEARVDYLSDMLGIPVGDVVMLVNLMRQDGLLADSRDMTAYIYSSQGERRSLATLKMFAALEAYVLQRLGHGELQVNMKELNEDAQAAGVRLCNVKRLRSLLYFMTIRKHIRKEEHANSGTLKLTPLREAREMTDRLTRRVKLCEFILNTLYTMVERHDDDRDLVRFSVIDMLLRYKQSDMFAEKTTIDDVEEALLYLTKIDAMRIDGGFFVSYNSMRLERLEMDNKIRYKADDYAQMNDFYRMRMQQIHIVGEYANMMMRDMPAAMRYVSDYFTMEYSRFINKYFKGERREELNRNVRAAKYKELFGSMSARQSEIINDTASPCIVVAAGPGSGKTRVLVHKLAALLLMEDVKHDGLLMLTFSRQAATEFKRRLIELVGAAAYYVDIMTFHSYCFNLLGRVGTLEASDNVVHDAVAMIRTGEVEPAQITKTVLVLDEAQDMSAEEYALVSELMTANPAMRVIAVGDDDQNIYAFRGSSSQYMEQLAKRQGAKLYELTDNYRSTVGIVRLANEYASSITHRMKSQPINAVSKSDGEVSLIRYTSPNMEEAVAAQVLRERDGKSCCVLTMRNDEAVAIHSLLLRNGVQAKLIQSIGGFDLTDMAEVRYFLKLIGNKEVIIPDDVWEKAVNSLRRQYQRSECLPALERMLSDFSQTRQKRYYTDLCMFIKESKYEDFIDGGDTVIVSTIHKAKGREFDTVHMMLKDTDATTEEQRRVIYVGMTRAKQALRIHSNTAIIDKLPSAKQITSYDRNEYNPSAEIIMQLTHRDVVLSYFKGRDKAWLLSMQSGDALSVRLPYICYQDYSAIKLSAAAMKQVQRYVDSGYTPTQAQVRFVVAWREDGDEDETAVILPTLYLRRK